MTGFPTGRFFGCITQKGPSKNVSGRTNLWQNFGLIFPEMAKKGPNIKMFCFLYFSHMEHKKSRIFTDFCTGMVSKFSNILMKWNQRWHFYKGAEFVGHCCRNFFEKSWQHCQCCQLADCSTA
jgi:hypothetical protein